MISKLCKTCGKALREGILMCKKCKEKFKPEDDLIPKDIQEELNKLKVFKKSLK